MDALFPPKNMFRRQYLLAGISIRRIEKMPIGHPQCIKVRQPCFGLEKVPRLTSPLFSAIDAYTGIQQCINRPTWHVSKCMPQQGQSFGTIPSIAKRARPIY